MITITQDHINKYIPVNTLNDISITPGVVERALYKFFPPFIGNELVENLASDEPNAELTIKVIPALTMFAFFIGTPFFDVILTSAGFAVHNSQNSSPASRERVSSLKEACQDAANDFMHNLLVYLETNEVEGWNQSSLLTDSLIGNADIFNDSIEIASNRVTFFHLKKHIKNNQVNIIQKAISKEFLTELIDSDDSYVKPNLQNALAYFAMADYTLQKIKETQDNSQQNKAKALRKIGEEYLISALAFLQENLTMYDTYATYGYEEPYKNEFDDDVEDPKSFFVGG